MSGRVGELGSEVVVEARSGARGRRGAVSLPPVNLMMGAVEVRGDGMEMIVSEIP